MAITSNGHTNSPQSSTTSKHTIIKEGLAEILIPKTAGTGSQKKNEPSQTVFYNPIQQFNRDLSVLAILAYGEAALSARQAKYVKKGGRLTKWTEKRKSHGKAVTEGTGKETDKVADSVRDEVVEQANAEGSKKRKREEDNAVGTQLDGHEEQNLTNGASKEAQNGLVVEEVIGGASERPAKVARTVEGADSSKVAEVPSVTLDEDASQKDRENTTVQTESSEQFSRQERARKPTFAILDALSATGLRALRYAKEIPFVTAIVANDLSPEAIKSMKTNIDHNQVSSIVEGHTGDARTYMYSLSGDILSKEERPTKYFAKFDVIDLDPYGTAAPFFDCAVQSIADGGLLCVTCTDASVFASNGYPEKTYALYGGIPIKGAQSHEGGLRLILHGIAAAAAKYGIAIEPLLSLSIDFYARLFIRVHKSASDVKLLAGNTMLVYNCDQGCGAWTTQMLARNHDRTDKKGGHYYKHGFAQGPSTSTHCEHCGFKTHVAGPMWAGPLQNPYFITRILDKLPRLDKSTYATLGRIEGMLTTALEEDLTSQPQQSQPQTPEPQQPQNPTSVPAPAPAPAPAPDTTNNASTVPPHLPIPRLPSSHQPDPNPFFFIPSYLCKVLHTETLSEAALRGALTHLSHPTTRSHCKPGSIKTTAPWPVIWEVLREWVRQKSPTKSNALNEGTAGYAILKKMRGTDAAKVEKIKDDVTEGFGVAKDKTQLRTILEAALYRLRDVDGGGGSDEMDADPTDLSRLDVKFDEALGKKKDGKRLIRYQENPRANWGPMNRARGSSPPKPAAAAADADADAAKRDFDGSEL